MLSAARLLSREQTEPNSIWTLLQKCQRWKSLETPAKSSHLRASCLAERRSAFNAWFGVCKSLLNRLCVMTCLGMTNILFMKCLIKCIFKLMNGLVNCSAHGSIILYISYIYLYFLSSNLPFSVFFNCMYTLN